MFSVVIPLYNKENNIALTINSVLNQDFHDFEVLIVNDGSTDNSLSVVEKIADERVRVIDKSNGGVASARNMGIQAASYDWIAFLDGDDLWKPDYLSKMKKLINDFPEASFWGCQFIKQEKGHDRIANSIHGKRGYVNNFFQKQAEALLISSSSVIIRKDCFEKVGYFNEGYTRGEDLDMWCRLARNYKFAFEPTPLCYYLLDGDDRACKKKQPLNQYYLEFHLSGKSRHERKFHLQIAEVHLIEMLSSKRFADFFRLAMKYNIYLIVIILNIIQRHLSKIIKHHYFNLRIF
jgi:Glycosyltransferases, probably involved in cell wall biogenesis